MKANILTFLQENIQRFFTKSPLFFKIWTIISGTFVLITGIPDLISSLPFHVTIPDLWNERVTLAVAWASRAALFMSLLTVKSPAIGVTDNGKGNIIKVTDSSKLPFTAASEQKSAIKNDISSVEVKVTS